MPPEQYRVKLTRAALKDLKGYRSDAVRVKERMDALRDNPLAGHPLSGSLAGLRSLEFSLRGSGQHRAIYVVRELTYSCVVVFIGSHENVYDRAERRLRSLDALLDEVESDES